MKCPYCGRDLLSLSWKYWSGNESEYSEFICPECGNNVIVVAKLDIDVCKREEIIDEI